MFPSPTYVYININIFVCRFFGNQANDTHNHNKKHMAHVITKRLYWVSRYQTNTKAIIHPYVTTFVFPLCVFQFASHNDIHRYSLLVCFCLSFIVVWLESDHKFAISCWILCVNNVSHWDTVHTLEVAFLNSTRKANKLYKKIASQ